MTSQKTETCMPPRYGVTRASGPFTAMQRVRRAVLGPGMIGVMDDTTILLLALGLGVPTFFALIIGIILFTGKARPKAGLGPRPTSPGAPATSGSWNVMIFDGPTGSLGGTLGATTGVFHVDHGALSFMRDGAPMPEWSVPCHQVAARAHSMFSTAGVLLWTPHAHIRCSVSRERLSWLSQNTLKTMREPRYYREFVGVLAANGARLV